MSTPGAEETRLPAWRLARRLGLLALVLWASGWWVGLLLPGRAYEHYYRPTWTQYGRYLAYLKAYRRAHPDQPLIVFAGSSAAWGFSNSPGHALPDEFERALHAHYRAGPLARAKVFNVCLPDNSAATDYYALRALEGVADAVYLQVHYRFFNLGWRARVILPPELLQQMGLWPSATERADLGGEWLAAEPGLGTQMSLWLARHWPLYRDRMALRELVYGGSQAPGEAGYERYEDWLERTGREHRASARERIRQAQRQARRERYQTVAWPRLPAWARVVPARDIGVFDFGVIRPANRNLRFLERIVRYARDHGQPLFCYTAVLNAHIMDPVSATWRPDYRRNMAQVARLFAGRTQVFVDYNERPVPPLRYFHDFDHLVDEGTVWQARTMLQDSREFLEGPVLERLAKRVTARS